MKETKEASGNAARIRRKSKELESELTKMAAASDQWQALGGHRSRRGSRDYTAESLQEVFNEIDDDKSGHIDRAELERVRSHTHDPPAFHTGLGAAHAWPWRGAHRPTLHEARGTGRGLRPRTTLFECTKL